MTRMDEILAAAPAKGLSHDARVALEHVRAMMRAQRPASEYARAERNKFKRFYQSRAWKAARYRHLKTLKPEARRCACCGITVALGARLVVDHIIPIRTEEGWRRRLTGPFQILCNDDNLSKGSSDQTDWREAK